MAITLNGTTGITTDGGYTGDGVSFADGTPSNTLVTTTGGNVGIGTNAPTFPLDVRNSNLNVSKFQQTGSFQPVYMTSTTNLSGVMSETGNQNGLLMNSASNYTTLWSGGAERMRIDSSGNLLVGQTASGGNQAAGGIVLRNPAVGSGGSSILISHATGTGNGNSFAEFSLGGSGIGNIVQSTASTVAYNTSSDYRLKENIAPMQNALNVVQQLKPVTYNWKVDGSSGQGFIAHELQAVVPDCVTGEKDAVDADGKPIYQGIDTSFLVATLTAAIQEQQAIITEQSLALQDLKARIETLENK